MEALLVWVKYQQGHGHTPQNVKWPYLKFRLGTNVPAPNPNPYPNPPPPPPTKEGLINQQKSKQFSFKSKKSLCSLKCFDKLLQSRDDTSWVS